MIPPPTAEGDEMMEVCILQFELNNYCYDNIMSPRFLLVPLGIFEQKSWPPVLAGEVIKYLLHLHLYCRWFIRLRKAC